MTPYEIADKLITYIRENNYVDAYRNLYNLNLVSIEDPIQESEMMPRTVTIGIEAKLKSSEEWMNSIREVHDDYAHDPIVTGNVIAIPMGMDVTLQDGTRMQLDEIAVYGVENGKIVKEQFIY